MKKLIVFTGAGISAESGLQTFRDSDGLWEEYNVMEVATPEAWKKNPSLVLDFYNKRKKQVKEAQPNNAHKILAKLEDKFDVQIITQNIDDLHERAGSKNVLHLHGLVTQARSSIDDNLIYDIGFDDIKLGDKCEKGSQLRPNIVWFGEQVPNMEIANKMVESCDLFVVIGTSLNVYPAAGLVHHVPDSVKKYLIDPKEIRVTDIDNLTFIKENATNGVSILVDSYL